LPCDWISSSNAPLLKNLCRHIHSSDLLAADIVRRREEVEQARRLESEATDLKAKGRVRYTRLQLEKSLRSLLTMHGYQSDRVVRLSTKLRLTMQSRYRRADAAATATAKSTSRPWTDWGSGRQK
jgi:hypothetical protein